MNRLTATLTATIAVIGFSACTPAEVKQFLAATRKPAVVNTRPTVVTPLPRNEATVTTYVVDIGTPLAPVLNPNAPCGETGGPDCEQPPTPPRPCGETGGPDCAQLPTPPTTTPARPCGESGGPDCDQQAP